VSRRAWTVHNVNLCHRNSDQLGGDRGDHIYTAARRRGNPDRPCPSPRRAQVRSTAGTRGAERIGHEADQGRTRRAGRPFRRPARRPSPARPTRSEAGRRMIPARPALASAAHPAFLDFGVGRRANLSGQVVVELDAYPGRRRPGTSRGAIIAPGEDVNRTSVRAGFRRSRRRPDRTRSGARRRPHMIRPHGRRVPWAMPGDWSGLWAHVGHKPEQVSGPPMTPGMARGMEALSVLSALVRTRARVAGKPIAGWLSVQIARDGDRPVWARIESFLAALAAVVAEQLPFLAWWLPRRDDSPGGRRHRAALLRSTTTPTRGPSRRPTAGHRFAGCVTS
jgi:hypothetical protein